MTHLQHNPILRTLIYLVFSIILLAGVSYILRTYGTREWLWAALIFLVIFFLFLLWKVPEWQVASLKKSTEPEKLVALKNELRKTLAQIMGGLLILVSLYGTWEAIENSDENLRISQEGQITERFTRAVEHLGNAKLEIRLGGIYALERISKDSPKDYWQVMEILTAYVRENSPRNLKQNPTNKIGEAAKDEPNKFPQSIEAEKLSTDIQAILSVIGRRILNHKKGEEPPLDLGKTNLYMARLEGVHLEGANLKEANLRDANLDGARLEEANLVGAYLYGANLKGANLTGANLLNANLAGANLVDANLAKTILVGINMERSHLEGVNLKGQSLYRANLKGAFLQGANLEGVDFYVADLRGTHNLTIEQLSKVKTLYMATLDQDFIEQIKKKYPHLLEKPKEL